MLKFYYAAIDDYSQKLKFLSILLNDYCVA